MNELTHSAIGYLRDDISHAIPSVNTFDTVLALDNGGAYIGMVINTPLDSSVRSLSRLRAKQQFYLNSFSSDFGKRNWGTPKVGKMRIYIKIHPDSCDEVFRSLQEYERLARECGIEVHISKTSIDLPGVPTEPK